MQTTATTPTTTLTTRPVPDARSANIATTTAQRLLLVLLLTLTVMTGTAATSAAPAEASTGANVSFCYRHPSGAAASNMAVHLRTWNGSSWVAYRSLRSNSRGCGIFYNVARNRHYTTLLQDVLGNPAYCGSYGYTVVAVSAWAPYYVTVTRTSTGNHYVGKATIQTTRIC